MSNKEHWEYIYTTKTPQEVSWTEYKPQTSLNMIAKFDLPKSAKIIDIGGGDSLLVDYLLELGYTNITVLDISETAIDRAKLRLGNRANKVKWIVSDIRDFTPPESYDLWHDRAAFHFLTTNIHIEYYLDKVAKHTRHLVLGTFSKTGPLKCSGLEITRYDEQKIRETFCPPFDLIECFNKDHITPFDAVQNFMFARLSKL